MFTNNSDIWYLFYYIDCNCVMATSTKLTQGEWKKMEIWEKQESEVGID